MFKIGFWISKYDIRPYLDVKKGFWMSKYDIQPQFQCQKRILNVKICYLAECQNRILNVKIRHLARFQMWKLDFEYQNIIFSHSSNVKIGFWMWKYDIRLQFECQNRDSECQNTIFNPCSNAKIGFWMSKYIFGPISNGKIGLGMSKDDIRPQFEFQNRILNVILRYLAPFRMSK